MTWMMEMDVSIWWKWKWLHYEWYTLMLYYWTTLPLFFWRCTYNIIFWQVCSTATKVVFLSSLSQLHMSCFSRVCFPKAKWCVLFLPFLRWQLEFGASNSLSYFLICKISCVVIFQLFFKNMVWRDFIVASNRHYTWSLAVIISCQFLHDDYGLKMNKLELEQPIKVIGPLP